MKIAIKPGGNGFCNRIYGWECIYEIAKINNADIMCDWKELEYLDFPLTSYGSDFRGFFPFNSRDLEKNNFILSPNYNYLAVCGFNFSRHFEEMDYKNKTSPKQLIKLKDDILSKRIEEITRDVIGVHIRRGDFKNSNGFTTQSCFQTPDSWYLNLMKQYKDKYGDVKFYISSDAEKHMLKIFYDNFDIIDCEYILERSVNKVMSYKPKLSCNYEDVVDLMALGKTKEIICSRSTWSMFAYQTNNKPYIWPEGVDQKLTSVKYWDNIKR